MKNFSLCVILLFMLAGFDTFAQTYKSRGRGYNPQRAEQSYIILDKKGRVKRFRYFVGDYMTFQLKGDEYKHTAQIMSIDSSGIEMLQTKVPVSEIEAVWIGKDTYWANFTRPASISGKILGTVLMGASLVALPIDKDKSLQMLGSGASMFALGSFFGIFQRRKYRLNKYRKLKIISTGLQTHL